MHLWTAPPGAPSPVEAHWIDLAPAPALPSALDTIVADHAHEDAPSLANLVRASVRTRWFVRPRASFSVLEDRRHPSLGVAAGHQWWSFVDVPVAPAGETGVIAMLPLGAGGYDLSLYAVGGAWLLDRVGLFVGPGVRADRVEWSDAVTDSALGLGPVARLVVDLGPVTPWAEVEPTWIVAGERAALPDAPWDAFEVRAGLILGQKLQLKLDAAHETTGSGEVWEASVGFHLHFG